MLIKRFFNIILWFVSRGLYHLWKPCKIFHFHFQYKTALVYHFVWLLYLLLQVILHKILWYFHHKSNKFFRPIFELVRNVIAVFSACFTRWNVFLDIPRTNLKQKSRGKYVIYVILYINQWILKTWFIAKTSLQYKVWKRVCQIDNGRMFWHMKVLRSC